MPWETASFQMPAAMCGIQEDNNSRIVAQQCCASPACQPSGVQSPTEASGASTSATEQTPVICRVVGCSKSIAGLKEYYAKRKVCHECIKEDSVVLADQLEQGQQRFCHQCGKFQALAEFDPNRRSCRIALQRRRRPATRTPSFKRSHLELGWGKLPAMATHLDALLMSGCLETQALSGANSDYYAQLLQLARQEYQQQLAVASAAGGPFSQAALLQPLSQQQQLDPMQPPNPLAAVSPTVMSSTPFHPGWSAPAVTLPAAGKLRRAPVKSSSCSSLLARPGATFTSAAAASALRKAQGRSRSSTPEALPGASAAAALQQLSLMNNSLQQQLPSVFVPCTASQPGSPSTSSSTQGATAVEKQLLQLRLHLHQQQLQQQQQPHSSTVTPAPTLAIPTSQGSSQLTAAVAEGGGVNGAGWHMEDVDMEMLKPAKAQEEDAWLAEIIAWEDFSTEVKAQEVAATAAATASGGSTPPAPAGSTVASALSLPQQQQQDELEGLTAGTLELMAQLQGEGQADCSSSRAAGAEHPLLSLNRVEELQKQMMVMQQQLSRMRAEALGVLGVAAM